MLYKEAIQAAKEVSKEHPTKDYFVFDEWNESDPYVALCNLRETFDFCEASRLHSDCLSIPEQNILCCISNGEITEEY